jgi:hypothetical protein
MQVLASDSLSVSSNSTVSMETLEISAFDDDTESLFAEFDESLTIIIFADASSSDDDSDF